MTDWYKTEGICWMSFASKGWIWAPNLCSLRILCNLADIHLSSLSILCSRIQSQRSLSNSKPASHRLSILGSLFLLLPLILPQRDVVMGMKSLLSQLVKKSSDRSRMGENAEKKIKH